jgi:hypothetical protein
MSHIITRCRLSDLAGGRPQALTRWVNDTQHQHVGSASPCATDRWATRGTRRAGPAVSQFFGPSHWSTPPLLHSALVAFLSPLVAHAHETPPSLSLPSVPPVTSHP